MVKNLPTNFFTNSSKSILLVDIVATHQKEKSSLKQLIEL